MKTQTDHFLKIVLVRHGFAEGEPIDEFGTALTPLGRKQAVRLAKRLSREKFNHIYASDLNRAQETASAVRAFHRRTPFTVTKALREIDEVMIVPGRIPGGRAVQEAVRRRRREIQRFAKQMVRKHARDDQILVVIHGNLIRFLISTFAGVNPKSTVYLETGHTSLNEVAFRNGEFGWVICTNDVQHLLQHQILYRL